MIETNGKKLNFKQYEPTSIYEMEVVKITPKYVHFSASCNKHLQNKRYCEVFYDEQQKILAVKPSHLETFKSLKIISNRDHSDKKISAKGFLDQFKITMLLKLYKPDLKGIKFKTSWSNKNKCFLIDLKNGG